MRCGPWLVYLHSTWKTPSLKPKHFLDISWTTPWFWGFKEFQKAPQVGVEKQRAAFPATSLVTLVCLPQESESPKTIGERNWQGNAFLWGENLVALFSVHLRPFSDYALLHCILKEDQTAYNKKLHKFWSSLKESTAKSFSSFCCLEGKTEGHTAQVSSVDIWQVGLAEGRVWLRVTDLTVANLCKLNAWMERMGIIHRDVTVNPGWET